MKKQFRYGSCIPESIKVYNKLKRKGYNPLMVEGWVEVIDGNDLLPDNHFLFYFDHSNYLKTNNNPHYNEYPRTLQHTWVVVNGHKIDVTKNQFNRYRGIKKYYAHERYALDK